MGEDRPREYFRIKNWDKYQDFHHKQRKNNAPPPWIKLSTAFFDDAGLADLPDSQRLAWVALLISAAISRNRVRFDADYIKRRFSLGRKPDLDFFMDQGFIEKIDVGSGALDREEDRDKTRQYVQAEQLEPTSAPRYRVQSTPAQPEEPRASLSVNRARLEADGAKLIAQIAEITGEDPTTIIGRNTSKGGKYRPAIRLDTLSDARLAYTIIDLRADYERVRPQPTTSGIAAEMSRQLAEKAKRANG